MEINKLLLEGYLVFGILLTYTITFILGVLTGDRNKSEKEYKEYVEQIQSKEKISNNGTKFTFVE